MWLYHVPQSQQSKCWQWETSPWRVCAACAHQTKSEAHLQLKETNQRHTVRLAKRWCHHKFHSVLEFRCVPAHGGIGPRVGRASARRRGSLSWAVAPCLAQVLRETCRRRPTVDGRKPAPPIKPLNDASPANANNGFPWFPSGANGFCPSTVLGFSQNSGGRIPGRWHSARRTLCSNLATQPSQSVRMLSDLIMSAALILR